MRDNSFQRYQGAVSTPFAAYRPPVIGLPDGEPVGICHFAQGAQPPPPLPARFFMRPYRIPLGAQAFVLGGQSVKFDLRRQGYTDGLLVHLSGTYTGANADLVPKAFAPYNAVAKFLITVPQSPLPPINAGGWTMHQWNLRNQDFAPFRKGNRFPAQGVLDANAYHASLVDQFALTVGAQTVHLWWYLPFHLSNDDIRGILPTGNLSQVSLLVTPAAVADLFTTPANFTVPVLTIDVTQVCLTPPPAGANIQGGGVDVSQAVTYDEFPQNIAAVGLQRVDITPNYTILGILHGIAINDLMTNMAQLSGINMRLNSSYMNEPPGLAPAVVDALIAGAEGVPMPDGVLLYDQDILGMADWVHTQDLTEIESTFSTALATAPATILTSTRRLVPLAA